MQHSISKQQIESLATDDASLKAAKSVAGLTSWSNLSQNKDSVWGECKGSGSKPYLVQMDAHALAFKCSCPSRKFPCKHSLALGLLISEYPNNFTENAPAPVWVSDWMSARLAKAEKSNTAVINTANSDNTALNTTSGAETPADKQKKIAQAQKKFNQRHKRLADGLEELQIWLADQIKHGLGRLPKQLELIKHIASRMIDGQMPSVAKRLNEIHDLVGVKEDWIEQILAELGRLQLMIDAFGAWDKLSIGQQSDLLVALGVVVNDTDPALTVTDTWQVMGIVFSLEKKLWRRAVWFKGMQSNQLAQLIEFNFGNKSFDPYFEVGQFVEATCQYFSSAFPLRAKLESITRIESSPSLEMDMPQTSLSSKFIHPFDITQGLTYRSQQLAVNPWSVNTPWFLHPITIEFNPMDNQLIANDSNYALPLALDTQDGWTLLAAAGKHQVSVFGEMNRHSFVPLSGWLQGQLIWINEGTQS